MKSIRNITILSLVLIFGTLTFLSAGQERREYRVYQYVVESAQGTFGL